MLHIALKMLFGDKAKYIMLVSGLTFATLLMAQQSSVFCGIMRWTTAMLRNVRASVWVVDPKVEQINEVKPLRDTDLNRVRSVPGVQWAAPLFSTIIQARDVDGSFKNVQLIGIDSATLIGLPNTIIQGDAAHITRNNAVIVDQVTLERFNKGRQRRLQVGDTLEINDREAHIVAICKSERSFTGAPNVFTLRERAMEYAPQQRRMLSYILVEPTNGKSSQQLAKDIADNTGLLAFSSEDMFWQTIRWYFKNTGIPMSFGTVVLLGVIVGSAVAGQTFYTFVLENLKSLGALKAMGVSNWTLARMLVCQVMTVGVIGFGLGMGLAAAFGFMTIDVGQPPFFMMPEIMWGTAIVVFLICMFAAMLGIIKISRLEPAIVFRA